MEKLDLDSQLNMGYHVKDSKGTGGRIKREPTGGQFGTERGKDLNLPSGVTRLT